MPDIRLMIAGPVEASDEVLAAIGEQTLPHYGAAWMKVFNETSEMLKRLFRTENDVIMMPGPGSSAFDAAVGSLIPAGDSICLPSNGFFGKRMTLIAEANDIYPYVLDFPLGEIVDPDVLREKLSEWVPQAEKEGRPIRAIGLIHHETGTGVLNPLKEVVAVAREFDLPIILDAVSSLGGTELLVDEWDIDVCITVPNKCLGVPPGFAMMSISDRAWQMAEENPSKHGWYQDLRTWRWYIENWGAWHPYPTTMPTNNIRALHQRLLELESNGGLDSLIEATAASAQRVRDGMIEMGFTLYPKPEQSAPMVSAFNKHPEFEHEEMRLYLVEEHQVMISGGLAELSKAIFRVGHMGRAVDEAYSAVFLSGVRAFMKTKGLL